MSLGLKLLKLLPFKLEGVTRTWWHPHFRAVTGTPHPVCGLVGLVRQPEQLCSRAAPI